MNTSTNDRSPDQPGRRRWRWVAWVALAFIVIAVAGIGSSSLMLSRWGDVQTVEAARAEQAFVEALREAGRRPGLPGGHGGRSGHGSS